jgi:hypothetical protein
MPIEKSGCALTVMPQVAVTPEYIAVKVTGVEVFTIPDNTEKLAEVAPCGTITDGGTPAAEEFELESVTTAPPVPAAVLRVTLPVPDWPLTIVLGLTEMPLRAAGTGLTLMPKVAVKPEYLAVSVTGVAVLTLPAATVKLAEVEPCRTVTDDGTLAAGEFELDSVTTSPPPDAASVRLIVPEPDWPLTIVPGDTETLSATAVGYTVNSNVSLTPARDAVKVTDVDVATPPVVTGNVVEVEPCGTVTLVDMLTSVGNELRLIVVPPIPASSVNATEQFDPAAGLTAAGMQEKPFKPGVWIVTTEPN